jgi:protein SCO1/2
MKCFHRIGVVLGLAGLALLALTLAAGAQPARSEALPEELEGLGIFPRPGESLPLELEFTDSKGDTVRIGDYFEAGRPVLLNLVYYNCPMLCNLFLDGFVAGLKELEWTAGQEFEIVTVSIDPRESVDTATRKKGHQIENYGRPSAATGWHFLISETEDVRTLADAVGFKYRFNEETGEYMHAAGLFVVTPEGVISQTLFGLIYKEQTLRLSLVEASAGKIGSILDHALLFCFNYDSETGQYAPAAWAIMRLGVGAAALALAATLITLWVRGRRRGRVALGGTRS